MKSGEPKPQDDLRLLMEQKRSQPSVTLDVVSAASAWLKAQLKGARATYNYAACQAEDYSGFSVLVVTRWRGQTGYFLELRVTELGGKPFVFAEVRTMGHAQGRLFPFFGEIHTEEGRARMLHYIADFLLSTSEGQGS